MKNFAKKIAVFGRQNAKGVGFLLFLMCVSAHSAFASSGGSSGLPWEGPLTMVKDSLTGPVALGISTCALFASGATLVFGGEMTEFVKRALYAVVAISFIVGGASFMSSVFGVSGANVTVLHTFEVIKPIVRNISVAV